MVILRMINPPARFHYQSRGISIFVSQKIVLIILFPIIDFQSIGPVITAVRQTSAVPVS